MDKKWDEKQNKYMLIPDKNRIPRKLTKKIVSVSVNTDYGNMIPQIRKGAEQNKKLNGSEREFFHPVYT